MTTAAVTAFTHARVPLYGKRFLYMDGNSKITAGNGSFEQPGANAFSLVQIKDCPHSTPTCAELCYVHNLEKFQPDIHRLYDHNSREIREILFERPMTSAEKMADHIAEHCRGGMRWHVSGDVFSALYAEWIRVVCERVKVIVPELPIWIYTRSFPFVEQLMTVSTTRGGNLAINISADQDNWEAAYATANLYGLRVCYMTKDGKVPRIVGSDRHMHDVIFPDYSLRGSTPEGQNWFGCLTPQHKRTVCPVDFHGKAPNRRCGPCDRCMT